MNQVSISISSKNVSDKSNHNIITEIHKPATRT